jgi:hypothetical protein
MDVQGCRDCIENAAGNAVNDDRGEERYDRYA